MVEYLLRDLIGFSFSTYSGTASDLDGVTPDLCLGKSEEGKC